MTKESDKRENYPFPGRLGRNSALHEMREYEPQLRTVFSDATQRSFDENIYHQIANFVGANEKDLILHTKLIPMVSLFQGIYLKSITRNKHSILCYKKAGHGDEEIALTPARYQEIYGARPELGNFTEADKRFLHKEFGYGEKNDVALSEMYTVYNEFVITSKSDRDYLRSIGLGEIQLWLMWRYFTKRSINVNHWKNEFFKMTGVWEFKQRDDEDENQWGTRVWRLLGGDYIKTSEIRAMNDLNIASRVKACSFTFGCPQNLPKEDAPYANRLSWEREHSRPQRWGGTDQSDYRVMCSFHNSQKGDSWWFDTEQLTIIAHMHNLNFHP